MQVTAWVVLAVCGLSAHRTLYLPKIGCAANFGLHACMSANINFALYIYTNEALVFLFYTQKQCTIATQLIRANCSIVHVHTTCMSLTVVPNGW